MPLNNKSRTVEFYNAAIVAMLTQMGESTDIEEIDSLRDEVHRLTNRMADQAFGDLVNRTFYLKSLINDLKRLTIGAGGAAGGQVAPWIGAINAVLGDAQKIVDAATGE